MPARIEDVWWDDDVLRLKGYAYIAFQELPTEKSGRIRLTLEESGHPDSVIPLEVRRVRRPDVTEAAPDGVTNYDGSGWEAALPVSALRHRGKFRTGNWRLRLEVRAKGVTRRRWLSGTDPGRAKRPGWQIVDGARIVPTTQAGNFGVEISTTPAEVEDIRVDGTVLELTGTLHGRRFDPATASLRAARDDGTSSRGPAGRHRRIVVRRQHPVRRAGRHQHPRQTRTSTRPSRTVATSPTATSGASPCCPTRTVPASRSRPAAGCRSRD